MRQGTSEPGRDVGTAGRQRRRPVRGTLAAGAAIAVVSIVAAACGSSASTPSAGNKTTVTTAAPAVQPTGAAVKGGTVAWAEQPAATPSYIFPMPPLADFSNANLYQFENLMYRPLYWFGDNGKPLVDMAKSLAAAPVFTNDDKTVTMTLNNGAWSDGEKLEARDVVFWMNLLKAEKANWGGYVPGYFPDNVKSISMPAGPTGATVEFQLTSTVNPTWFLYNELSQVVPLPIAWDKTSASAPAPSASASGLPDATPAGAKAVYTFLTGQSASTSTYTTNPLWKIVDGPWTLTGFTSQGEATFVPNPKYVGPDHPYLSKFVEVPYTTDVAEYDTVKSGNNALQVGYVPAQDLPKLASVESEGYKGFPSYLYAFNYMAINFNSKAVGALFKQLYIRQALQELFDQSGWVKAYFDNLAEPTYGPVPVVPPNTFADAYERSDPYPFSPTAAAKLLTTHGWAVHPGGTTTCSDGTKCGPGIKTGEGLTFALQYASGSVPLTSSITDLKSVAATVGVQIEPNQQTFNTVIGNAVPSSTSWEIANWGGGWSYGPDYYASGEELFQTGAGSNHGAYSDPKADELIKATTAIGVADSQSSLDTYQNYLAQQLPVLYQPEPATENVVAKNLGGSVLTPNPFDSLDPENWYFTK